jgi:GNAT superfamily N-acetyltransferase
MSDITIRPRLPADDERYLAIRDAIAFDRPPVTLEEHRRSIELEPERAGHTIVTAERDGEVVGQAAWSQRIFTSDEDTYWMDILVDRDRWGTGIGRALYDHAMAALAERGAKKVYVTVREDLPESEAFATRRSFTRTGHGDRISRLDVQHANLEKSRAAAERVQESGIRITTLDQLTVDRALLEELRALDQEVTVDIPGEEDYQAPPLDEWKLWMEMPGMTHDIFWVALDGDKIIGMAPLQRRAGGYADNAFTAVARAYRGRGIARALKLRTVEWAQQNGIRYIITGNDPANKPMLAINIDLGYQFLPANIQLAKEL